MNGSSDIEIKEPLSACKILEQLYRQDKDNSQSMRTAKWVTLEECHSDRVIMPTHESFYRERFGKADADLGAFQTSAPYISRANYHRLVNAYFKCKDNKSNEGTSKCFDELKAAEDVVRGYWVSGK